MILKIIKSIDLEVPKLIKFNFFEKNSNNDLISQIMLIQK